jgi:hypothetical protein
MAEDRQQSVMWPKGYGRHRRRGGAPGCRRCFTQGSDYHGIHENTRLCQASPHLPDSLFLSNPLAQANPKP